MASKNEKSDGRGKPGVNGKLSAKPESEKTGSGKKKGGKGKAVAIALPLLLIASAAVLTVFVIKDNLFGGREMILDALVSLDPEYQTLQDKAETLVEQEKELEEREEKLADGEAAFAEKQADAERAKAEADKAEAEDSLDKFLSGLSEERIEQIKQLAAIYSNMDPAEAAAVLSQLKSIGDISALLYCMKAEASAEIINNMEPALAAQVTQNMLS